MRASRRPGGASSACRLRLDGAAGVEDAGSDDEAAADPKLGAGDFGKEEKAEQEARQRDCRGAYIDTFNPHALHVYQKAGYTVFGTLPNFPPGRTRSFLSKDL